MKFGLCCSPSQLGLDGGHSTETFRGNLELLAEAGARYIEFPVGVTVVEGDEAQWEILREALRDAPLAVEAFNTFIPAHHRITGPAVNLNGVLKYCKTALGRCREAGATIVVLGSSGARKVPEGFPRDEAMRQFMEFSRELAPLARNEGITICLEPLNYREDNLLLTVEEGARLVDELGCPGIELLADFYHMQENGEDLHTVAAAGSRLRHTHLADIGRVAPGYAGEGEADFVGFFRALRESGYTANPETARCSFEGSYDDIFAQAAPMLSLLQRRYIEATS